MKRISVFLLFAFFVTAIFAQTADTYRANAEKGDAEAQFKLGECYYYGKCGVSKDFYEAVKWFRDAAKQGNADGQFWLGRCYQFGEGVSGNEDAALIWYRKAAEQGHPRATFNIGSIYKNKDSNEAKKWFEKAVPLYKKEAERGNAEFQWRLGICYELGDGVEKDLKIALYWYRKAAETGTPEAQYNLGRQYEMGNSVLSKNYTEAVKWYRKAAEQDYAIAQSRLGYFYTTGNGVEKNSIEAVKWFKKAAEQGDYAAQASLGKYYYLGEGVNKDKTMALYWLKKALPYKNFFSSEFAKDMEANMREIRIDLPDKFSEYAKSYVQAKINEWQQKGEYEKTVDWQLRVNETTRNEQISRLLKEAEDWFCTLKQKELDLTLGKYDADNEVYLVVSPAYGNLLVPVPYNDAQSFKTEWNNATKIPKFFIENDKIEIAEIRFETPDKIYTYSNKASLNYSIANIDYNFAPIDLNIPASSTSQKGNQNINTSNVVIGKSDVDIDIPRTSFKNDKTFAVIIANENYRRESQVMFAKNDGETFKKYCILTLGLPENNVHYVADATLNDIRGEINWLCNVAHAFSGEASIIFYYAGHGIPDESSKTAYLLPVDGFGSDVATGYKLDDLYT